MKMRKDLATWPKLYPLGLQITDFHSGTAGSEWLMRPMEEPKIILQMGQGGGQVGDG